MLIFQRVKTAVCNALWAVTAGSEDLKINRRAIVMACNQNECNDTYRDDANSHTVFDISLASAPN